MSSLTNYLIVFTLTLIIHEIGRYIAYIYYGYEPSINFKKYGILIGGNIYNKIRLDKYFYITLTGVITGLLIAIWNPIVLLLYPFIYIIDFIILITIIYYEYKGEEIRLHTIETLTAKTQRINFWKSIIKQKPKWYNKILRGNKQ